MSKATDWFLLELGCAECGDMPLALPRGLFASEAEARAASGDKGRWLAHPSGGSFTQWGSGGFWVAPVSAFTNATAAPFGSQYDEEYR